MGEARVPKPRTRSHRGQQADGNDCGVRHLRADGIANIGIGRLRADMDAAAGGSIS
jgi:hypothetical protein